MQTKPQHSLYTALYCTVLYCTVLYCTVLYCTALYCQQNQTDSRDDIQPSDRYTETAI